MTTIRQSQNVSVVEEGISPRTRRWGFMPGLYFAEMEPRESGQSERAIEQGVRVLFETAQRREQNFNIHDEDFIFEENKERPAKFYIDNVKKQYAHFGFVELDMLTSLSDEDAAHCFAIVHPEFTAIDHTCPEGLNVCATCRIALLEQQAYGASPEEELRLRLLQSYVSYRDYAGERWSSLIGEREDRKNGKPGMAKFGESEHHLRRHLHAIDPDLAAAHAAKGFGDASANATLEGMKVIADSMRRPEDGSLVEAVAQLAQNQAAAEHRHAEQMAMLTQLIVNQGTNITASVTEQKRGPGRPPKNPAKEQTDE